MTSPTSYRTLADQLRALAWVASSTKETDLAIKRSLIATISIQLEYWSYLPDFMVDLKNRLIQYPGYDVRLAECVRLVRQYLYQSAPAASEIRPPTPWESASPLLSPPPSGNRQHPPEQSPRICTSRPPPSAPSVLSLPPYNSDSRK